jgi:hypothetical protein
MKDSPSKIKSEIAAASQDAIRAIAQAAKDAANLIAASANEARSVVTAHEAEAVKVLAVKSSETSSDHDLITGLVENVRVNFEQIKSAISDIKEGTTSRIDKLEVGKLNTSESYVNLYKQENDKLHSDKELRLRLLEQGLTRIATWGSAGIIALGVVEFIISRIFK